MIIVKISATIEIETDDPSGLESVRDGFEGVIEREAEDWGSIISNEITVEVTE